MKRHSATVAAGLLYTLPLLLWTLSALNDTTGNTASQQLLRDAVTTTLLLQGAACTLLLAALPSPGGWRQWLLTPLSLLAPPWPLLLLAWQIDALSATPLLLAQGGLLLYALLLQLAVKGIRQSPIASRWHGLLLALLQLLSLYALLQFDSQLLIEGIAL